MSKANKNLLSKRFNEYKEEISTEPTRRKLNDHALLIDGLNTFIRAFSINPSLNEDGSHVGGLIGGSVTIFFLSLMMVLPYNFNFIAIIFSVLCIIGTIERIYYAYNILNNK